MIEEAPWYQGIREIHDQHLHDLWEERVDAINQRYGLAGEHQLISHGPGVPMPWFNGDIEAVEPGNWVLVISLNHQIDPEASEVAARYAGGSSSTEDASWDERRTMNSDRWYGRFFSPLARVAAAAVQEQITQEEEPEFATRQMIFVEICPYASNRFNLDWPTIEALLASDFGFQLASRVNRQLIQAGEPALVMINGGSAIEMVQHLYADALDWREFRYDSCDPPREGRKPKRLRHYCGSLCLRERPIPVVGFPFLRTPATHNSKQEVALLGDQVRRCVRAQRHGEFPDSAV